jgi:hypothetical protein
MRIALIILIVIHGIIHLFGFLKALGISEFYWVLGIKTEALALKKCTNKIESLETRNLPVLIHETVIHNSCS